MRHAVVWRLGRLRRRGIPGRQAGGRPRRQRKRAVGETGKGQGRLWWGVVIQVVAAGWCHAGEGSGVYV